MTKQVCTLRHPAAPPTDRENTSGYGGGQGHVWGLCAEALTAMVVVRRYAAKAP